MPILTEAFGRGAMDRVHDRNRDIEFGSLHRISDELAEFASTLPRMAEIDRKSEVADKPISFSPCACQGIPGFSDRHRCGASCYCQIGARYCQEAPVALTFSRRRAFADPACGHFARFESGRPLRAKCLGIEPLHSRSRAPHNCSSLDHRDDRERNAGAAARSRRCAKGIY